MLTNKFRFIFMACLNLLMTTFGFSNERMIQSNEIELWCESFGNPQNPAFLLIAGGGCQGIMWPKNFCHQLAEEGFFVLRYDHRDLGLSAAIDFDQSPYDLVDLAQDAIGILDHYGIDQAHFIGTSMGGAIAQLIAVYHPQRVKSLVLMSTSSDFSILMDTLEGKVPTGHLSKPSDAYLDWIRTMMTHPAKTNEQRIAQSLNGWKLLNGSIVEFDEELYRDLLTQQLQRLRHPGGLSHQILAIKASLEEIKQAPSSIHVPTLIIHGTEDPIFPIDHGHALAKLIQGVRLVVINGMGHNLNTHFYGLMIACFKQEAQSF